MTDQAIGRPSMHDVAALAGVSHKTVWRVINDPASVRSATRDRVLSAVDELGYRLNVAARRLVTQRSGMLGIVASPDLNYGPTRTLYAVARATRESGYQPLIAIADPHDPGHALDMLLEHAVEGVLVVTTDLRTNAAFERISETIPVLKPSTVHLIDGRPFQLYEESVPIANIARHLRELGHRVVQQVCGPEEFVGSDVRRDAVDRALRAEGMQTRPPIRGDWSASSGYTAADEVAPDVTAVVCSNDQMALGVIKALTSRGRRVPEDVSIVGFDDLPEAEYFRPALTTVRVDYPAVAAREVALALALVEGYTLPASSPIEPSFIVRESTGPAPR